MKNVLLDQLLVFALKRNYTTDFFVIWEVPIGIFHSLDREFEFSFILATLRAARAPPRDEFLLSCDDYWTLTGPGHPSGGPCGAWLRQCHVTSAGLESDTYHTA